MVIVIVKSTTGRKDLVVKKYIVFEYGVVIYSKLNKLAFKKPQQETCF